MRSFIGIEAFGQKESRHSWLRRRDHSAALHTLLADYGLRFHKGQNIGPSRPQMPQRSPEPTIPAVQPRPGPFPFENGHLLSKSEDLQGGIRARVDENAKRNDQGKEEAKHESML